MWTNDLLSLYVVKGAWSKVPKRGIECHQPIKKFILCQEEVDAVEP